MDYTKYQFAFLFLPLLAIVLLLSLSPAGRATGTVAAKDKPVPPDPGLDSSAVSVANRSAALFTEPVANCRYGVTTKSETDQVDWVDDFGAGWFLDFLFYSPPASNGAEFAPIIYVRQDKDEAGNYLPSVKVIPPLTDGGLGPIIDRNPGSLWIIGNEVDRGPGPGNSSAGVGDTFPDAYARTYHDAYKFIKQRDPMALVGISGLVEVTPGRLQYLDLVWDTYLELYHTPMPVDVWNMHLYILPEVMPDGRPNDIASVALGTDPALGIRESGGLPAACTLSDVYCVAEHDDIDIFAEQVVAMRTWMRDHGQRQKPLILSEYSILYPYYDSQGQACSFRDENNDCFDPQRVASFMAKSFNYLETEAFDSELGYSLDNDRLVQQWNWFSVYRPFLGHASNLITADEPPQLTPAGLLFQQSTFSSALYVNLLPGWLSNPKLTLVGTGTTVTATLTLAVHNNGTERADSPFEVAFFRDSALNDLIGTGTVPGPEAGFPGMTGCGTRYINVTVDWPGLPEGEHPFWVKIDYLDEIGESDEGDNVASGIVSVGSMGIFLPALIRYQ